MRGKDSNMKFQVLQSDISQAVAKASRFASSRAQLPVLGNILFKTDKNKIIVASTNLEVSFATSIGAQVETEGDITIPARIAHDLFSTLKSGQVTLSVEKEVITVTTDSFESKIPGMNASDFPSLPLTSEKSSLVLDVEALTKALSKVSFAVSVDETRPVLTGVLFIFEKNELTVVATDGFRLSTYTLSLETPLTESQHCIIPKTPLVELPKLETVQKEIGLFFDTDNNQVVFSAGKNVLATRIIEGEFPEYGKIIPKDTLFEVVVDKDEFARAVKLASIFARDSANVVTFTLKSQELELSAKSAQKGTQKSTVAANITSDSSPEFTIAFNCKFMEDFLGSVKGDTITMKFINSEKAGIFLDSSDPEYLHLIMPVKL